MGDANPVGVEFRINKSFTFNLDGVANCFHNNIDLIPDNFCPGTYLNLFPFASKEIHAKESYQDWFED
jgi:hypothetical protein